MSLARWLALLLLACAAVPARAHDALPIALHIEQTGADSYALRARFPPFFPPGGEPRLGVEAPCRVARAGVTLLHLRCPRGVSPTAVTLAYAGPAGNAPTVLRLAYSSGQRATVVGRPGAERLALPGRETAGAVFAQYFVTGFGHILGGIDHLLFLFCLILIAGSGRRVVWAVGGFTLGHAVTICLAALGLVAVNTAAIEVLIALSIVFAAAEAAQRREDGLMTRHPAVIAALFGLLHGLGFAGALLATGLPQGEIAVSLLAFNLGIEAGQLVFVVAVLAVLAVIGRIPALAARSTGWHRFAAWPAGIASSWFTFDRLLG